MLHFKMLSPFLCKIWKTELNYMHIYIAIYFQQSNLYLNLFHTLTGIKKLSDTIPFSNGRTDN